MKRIKDLRLEYGLNLKQLGAALGVSESTAQRYETEEISNLKYDTIVALANLFECTPGYLMGWDSDDAAHRHRKLIKVLDTLNDEGKAKVYEYAQLLTSSEQYRG